MLTLLLAADHFPGLGCASKKIISCRLVFHKNGAIKQLGLIQTSQRKFKFLAFSVLSRLSTFIVGTLTYKLFCKSCCQLCQPN